MLAIGVFGASFNPPTLGHRDVINQARAYFDEILLVPSASHPFHKCLAPLDKRLKMLEIFVKAWQGMSPPKIKILNIEPDLLKKKSEPEVVYTFNVLSAIEESYQKRSIDCRLQFIVGPDNAHPEIWRKFHRHQEIAERWPLFIAKENIPIHSTLVKEQLQRYVNDRKSLYYHVSQLVGEELAEYLLTENLYPSPSKREGTYG